MPPALKKAKVKKTECKFMTLEKKPSVDIRSFIGSHLATTVTVR